MDRVTRGDIWTIAPVGFPKPRPALVLSINPINDLCPDILLVPLTTKPGPLRVEIAHDADVTGLERTSYAKCEVVGPVHRTRLKEKIGHIPTGELGAVEDGVRRVLGLQDRVTS